MVRSFSLLILAGLLMLCSGQGCPGVPSLIATAKTGIAKGVYTGSWTCSYNLSKADADHVITSSQSDTWEVASVSLEFGDTGELLTNNKNPVEPGDRATGTLGAFNYTQIIATIFVDVGEVAVYSNTTLVETLPDGSKATVTGPSSVRYTQNEDRSVSAKSTADTASAWLGDHYTYYFVECSGTFR